MPHGRSFRVMTWRLLASIARECFIYVSQPFPVVPGLHRVPYRCRYTCDEGGGGGSLACPRGASRAVDSFIPRLASASSPPSCFLALSSSNTTRQACRRAISSSQGAFELVTLVLSRLNKAKYFETDLKDWLSSHDQGTHRLRLHPIVTAPPDKVLQPHFARLILGLCRLTSFHLPCCTARSLPATRFLWESPEKICFQESFVVIFAWPWRW